MAAPTSNASRGAAGRVPGAIYWRVEGSLFEPIHGSAPTLAGKDVANPIGSILSATMMLRDTFGLSLEADWVEQSVVRVLNTGVRTADIAEPGKKTVSLSVFNEMLHDEMLRTFEHAEKYGWGV